MNYRPMLVTNTILIAAMGGASCWAWGQIPDTAQIPVHWGITGEVDRHGTKAEALLTLPAIGVVTTLIMWIVPRLDPRRENIEASATFWNAVSISIGLFLAYLHFLLVATALQYRFDMLGAMLPGLSLLFAAIGNYLGKARSNWFGGVRTPWTMSSEYAWSRSHRLAGRMFVLTGLAGLIAWATLPTAEAVMVLLGGILLSTFITIAASYVYWRMDPSRTTSREGRS